MNPWIAILIGRTVKKKVIPVVMDFLIEAVEELADDTQTEVDDKAVEIVKKYRGPIESIIVNKL